MAQKVRVFKLAREFGVGNDTMVARIQNLGFAVRNYMSALGDEDAQRVRRLLEKEREENTVEERIRPTVIRRRAKPVKPVEPPPPAVEESAEVVEPVASAQAVEQEPAAVETPAEQEAGIEADLEPEPRPDLEPEPEPQPEEEPEGIAAQVERLGAEQEKPSVEKIERPQSLRPASEAPVVRRRVAPAQEEGGRRRKGSRRRQVESREITPSRRYPGSFAPGRKRRMTPGKKGKKTEITVPKASKRVIRIEEQITLQELAKRMSVKSVDLLMKLIGLGVSGVNINSTLDSETAKIVAEEFGYDVEDVAVQEEDLLARTRSDESEEERKLREPRAPMVTMMGHVDHGKTSLLDSVRKSDVVSGEAGGITQHVGAYRVSTGHGTISFVDTPGHEAFTAMRARGANLTDIVVLVVAADDGVMPQTIEAIDHARAAEVPIIVAVNKCDVQNADPARARRMLMENNLVPDELGGDVIVVDVSAKTGEGIDKLLEMISLQAEVMELDANPKRAATGVVLEAYLDRGRGPVANVVVQEGTLGAGDCMVAGAAYGKLRALTDEYGRKVEKAGPSTPVEVLGLGAVPGAGDIFDVVPDLKLAEKIGDQRAEKKRSAAVAPSAKPSLEALYQQMQAAEQAELQLIIKSDVQGTMEALRDSLTKLSAEKVKVNIVHASVGGITESDVMLASTAGAIIIGFNVRPAGKARKLAEEHGVEIRVFSVIYEVVDSVKQAMVGMLEPEIREESLGQVEVRDTFKIPKVGTVAGSYVLEGKVQRNAKARLIRDSVQIWEGRLSSLRRFKDDVREVQSGFECGICLEGYNDVKTGDVIEIYTEKEVEASLG